MKKTLKITICICLSAILVLCFASCQKAEKNDLWANAKYTEDTVLGSGKTTVKIKVAVQDKSVLLTLNTDKEILGDALLQSGIAEGEKNEFGLYIKKVNGILADYDTDKSYWALSKNGEYLQTGADAVNIASGEQYELTYSK